MTSANRSRSRNAPAVKGLLVFLFVLSPRTGNEPRSSRPFTLDRFTAEDAVLVRLIGESRIPEAESAGRARLEVLPRSCNAYRLVVEAARKGGWLDDAYARLAGRPGEPPDLHRLHGLALALAELGEERRALNVLSFSIHRGSPCLADYSTFVQLSSKHGRLSEARYLLRSIVEADGENGSAHAALGMAYQSQGEGLAARRAFERALIAAPPVPGAHDALAHLLFQSGEFEATIHVLQLGRALAEAEGEPETQIRLAGLEAFVLLMLGKKSAALEAMDRALETAEDWKVGWWLAETLFDASDLASAAGEGDRSRRLRQRAARIDDRAWAERHQARFRQRLGAAWLGTSDLPRAKAELDRALELALRVSEPHLETDVRLSLVHFWTMSGETTTAIEEGARALSRALELEDGDRQAQALAALGAVYDRLGRYRDALESYRQALRFEERSMNRQRQALALGNLALVYLRMGLTGPAVFHASQGVEVGRVFEDHRLQVSLRQSLAAALAGAGDFYQSERTYAETLELAAALPSPLLQGLVLSGRARVLLALGRFEEAEQSFRQALVLAERNGDALLLLQSRSGLALVEWRSGDRAAALALLEESRVLVERSRGTIRSESDRMSYSETSAQIYANLAAILTELDRLEPGRGHRRRAFLAVEQARARTLLDLVENSGRVSPAKLGVAVGEPLDASRLALAPDELFLTFELGERSSTVWVLSSAGLHWHELAPRAVIEASVESFLDTIRVPPQSPSNPFERHKERARSLYSMLLGPVEPELRRARRLVVSPASVLYRVPFEALVARGAEGGERYLIETHTVSYTPSASVLARLRRRPQALTSPTFSFVGVAQPGIGGDGFGPGSYIPHAVEEVLRVGDLFVPERRKLLIGRDANERAVKAASLGRSRMIHIAAHGLADERFPLRSALFVGRGPSSDEDGILSMAEVLDLQIDSALVVLSGCETGRGRLLRSEGALGFSWAFLSAGASSVAVSLWNVNDRATAELMVPFYENVVQGATLEQSLAEAKRRMLDSERRAYRHPYYWAPFVLIGSAGVAVM